MEKSEEKNMGMRIHYTKTKNQKMFYYFTLCLTYVICRSTFLFPYLYSPIFVIDDRLNIESTLSS